MLLKLLLRPLLPGHVNINYNVRETRCPLNYSHCDAKHFRANLLAFDPNDSAVICSAVIKSFLHAVKCIHPSREKVTDGTAGGTLMMMGRNRKVERFPWDGLRSGRGATAKGNDLGKESRKQRGLSSAALSMLRSTSPGKIMISRSLSKISREMYLAERPCRAIDSDSGEI